MKTLISAYACEPNSGSESGVGWNWVKQIARFHEVWVITRTINREVIEEELRKNPLPSVHFCYFDLPYILGFYKRGNRGIQLHSYLWQMGIYFLAKELHRQISFELIHHVTLTGVHRPVSLSFLPAPFIWGPVATCGFSWRFITEVGLTGGISEILRTFRNFLCINFDPFLRMTMKRASVIMPCNKSTSKMIPQKYRSKCILLSQVGISDVLQPDIDKKDFKNHSLSLVCWSFCLVERFWYGIKSFCGICEK